MFCIYCGKEINDTSQFCPHCGQKVSPETKEIIPAGDALSVVSPERKEIFPAGDVFRVVFKLTKKHYMLFALPGETVIKVLVDDQKEITLDLVKGNAGEVMLSKGVHHFVLQHVDWVSGTINIFVAKSGEISIECETEPYVKSFGGFGMKENEKALQELDDPERIHVVMLLDAGFEAGSVMTIIHNITEMTVSEWVQWKEKLPAVICKNLTWAEAEEYANQIALAGGQSQVVRQGGLGLNATRGVDKWLLVNDEKRMIGVPFVDYNGEIIAIELIPFDDLIDFELIEDGEMITKEKSGLGRAVAGGLLFGKTGAVVGAVTGKKSSSTQYCTDMRINLTVKNRENPLIVVRLISQAISKSSDYYRQAVEVSQKLIAILKSITHDRTEVENAVPAFSAADEILKFKNLLDMGVVTQEEFDKKKAELLGL